MKKILFTFFFMLAFGALTMAQEAKPQKFKLLKNSFSTELAFEANPVATEEIQVWIIPQGKKPGVNEKIVEFFTINRGKQTLRINTSNLPEGDYKITILQGLKGLVYSENIRKN